MFRSCPNLRTFWLVFHPWKLGFHKGYWSQSFDGLIWWKALGLGMALKDAQCRCLLLVLSKIVLNQKSSKTIGLVKGDGQFKFQDGSWTVVALSKTPNCHCCPRPERSAVHCKCVCAHARACELQKVICDIVLPAVCISLFILLSVRLPPSPVNLSLYHPLLSLPTLSCPVHLLHSSSLPPSFKPDDGAVYHISHTCLWFLSFLIFDILHENSCKIYLSADFWDCFHFDEPFPSGEDSNMA